MPLIAIYNPVCGNGDAKPFFDQHVLPLLAEHGRILDALIITEYAGHAGKAFRGVLDSVQGPGDVTVILGSGDGTLHEVINHVFFVAPAGLQARMPGHKLHFVLVPCGTANALYSTFYPPSSGDDDVGYRLRSVNSFINNSRTVPLVLAATTISSPYEEKLPQISVSSVVVSTALHANILNTSEKLRNQIPGLERFKVAARDNSTKWYSSRVRMLPMRDTGRVQIYDPDIRTFIDHPESSDLHPIVNVEGPFVYFLSVVNVDRLEPNFKIAPLVTAIPRLDVSCDIVLLRPVRDPSYSSTSNPRTSYVPKLWNLLSAAYENGTHVGLRYEAGGQITSTGNGPTVVEYIRCGGWEWIPEETDEDAHLLCSDGAIFHIEKGGRAMCSMVFDDLCFMVYV